MEHFRIAGTAILLHGNRRTNHQISKIHVIPTERSERRDLRTLNGTVLKSVRRSLRYISACGSDFGRDDREGLKFGGGQLRFLVLRCICVYYTTKIVLFKPYYTAVFMLLLYVFCGFPGIPVKICVFTPGYAPLGEHHQKIGKSGKWRNFLVQHLRITCNPGDSVLH